MNARIGKIERVTTTDDDPVVTAMIPVPVGGSVVAAVSVIGKDLDGTLRFAIARAVNSARRNDDGPAVLSSSAVGTVAGHRVTADLPRPQFFFAISGNDLALKVAGKLGMTINWEVTYEALVADRVDARAGGRVNPDDKLRAAWREDDPRAVQSQLRGDFSGPRSSDRPPAVGALVLHSSGPCGRVARVWEPEAYVAPGEGSPVSCAVVELSTGDALCWDEERAASFTVVPDPLATAYELLFLPRSKLFVKTASLFAAKLLAEERVRRREAAKLDPPDDGSADEHDPVGGYGALLARLLTAALREALKPPRGKVPG